ncbi:hypothetical protein A3732_17155 [Oleiphilus sp. HI0050]|nr:hypothetical protein A3732_17155 [Oleiphilus sp. HI0050]
MPRCFYDETITPDLPVELDDNELPDFTGRYFIQISGLFRVICIQDIKHHCLAEAKKSCYLSIKLKRKFTLATIGTAAPIRLLYKKQ